MERSRGGHTSIVFWTLSILVLLATDVWGGDRFTSRRFRIKQLRRDLAVKRIITSPSIPRPIALKAQERVLSTISQVNQSLLSHSRSLCAIKVGLVLKKDNDAPMHMTVNDDLVLPVSYAIDSRRESSSTKYRLRKHPIHTQRVATHEYGHALFRHALGKALPRFHDFQNLIKRGDRLTNRAYEVWQRIIDLQDKRKRMFAHLNVPKYMGPAHDAVVNSHAYRKIEYSSQAMTLRRRTERLSAKNRQLRGQMGMIDRQLMNNRDFRFFVENLVGYEELFADLIAVLSANGKPDTVAAALKRSFFNQGSPEAWSPTHNRWANVPSVAPRDFADRHNRLTKWKSTTAQHDTLGPTRFHLYEKYLRRPQFQTTKGKGLILDVVFSAVVQRIRRELRQRPQSSTFSAKSRARLRNEELIRAIDNTFSRMPRKRRRPTP